MNIDFKRFHTHPARVSSGLTLVELLVVITLVVVLAALALLMVRRGMDSAKTAATHSNLRQLHAGIMCFAADNGLKLPVNYFTATPGVFYDRDRFWYRAICKSLYPDLYERAPSYYGSPLLLRDSGYKGTVTFSPNSEKRNEPRIECSSYGYNYRFNIDNAPYTYLGRYNASRTCMFADNSGETHSLYPGSDTGAGAINPRNGASGPFKHDGKAAAIFLDGHAETISAARAREINGDRKHEFWGVEAMP